MLKRIIIFVTIIILLLIASLSLYIYKIHSLAVEANDNFGLRCTDVNPSLISYKASFLKFADAIQNPNKYKPEEIRGFYNDYISGMRVYVKADDKWLEKQKKLIERPDYQLLMPAYMNSATSAQWKMYEGYRNDAQYMIDMVDQKIPSDKMIGVSEARQKRDKAIEEYIDEYDKILTIRDWRMPFVSALPNPKGCNKDNMHIPETSGSIDWTGGKNKPTPAPNPFNLAPFS